MISIFNRACGSKNYILISIIILSLLTLVYSIYLSFTIPLIQDEVTTIMLIEKYNPLELLNYFYNGYDTQVPIYYLTLSSLSEITGNYSLYFFRTINIAISLWGVFLALKIFKKIISIELFPFYIWIISITGYYLFHIIGFLRPYSLFSTLFLYALLKYLDFKIYNKTLDLFIFIWIISLLPLIHYFGILYTISFLGIILIDKKFPQIRFNKIYLLIVLIPFLLWIPAILNQMNLLNDTIYHKTPTLIEVINIYYIFFRKLTWIILPVIILFIFKYFSTNFKKIDKDSSVISLLIFIMLPVVNYLPVLLGVSVYAERYFFPSMFVVIILFLLSIDKLFVNKGKYFFLTSATIMIIISIYRLDIFNNIITYEKQNYEHVLNLAKEKPVVCESPGSFLPLLYYAENKKIVNNLYLVMDNLSSRNSSNKSSLFDYYGMNYFKQNFMLANIVTWEEFIVTKNIFYLINQDKYPLYEYYIERNNEFKSQLIPNQSSLNYYSIFNQILHIEKKR